MDIRAQSIKAAKAIVKALDVLTFSPGQVAETLTQAPPAIQHRLYLVIRAVIKLWAIDARNRVYPPENAELYKWAKEHDK